jgi:hypothetical protein
MLLIGVPKHALGQLPEGPRPVQDVAGGQRIPEFPAGRVTVAG